VEEVAVGQGALQTMQSILQEGTEVEAFIEEEEVGATVAEGTVNTVELELEVQNSHRRPYRRLLLLRT